MTIQRKKTVIALISLLFVALLLNGIEYAGAGSGDVAMEMIVIQTVVQQVDSAVDGRLETFSTDSFFFADGSAEAFKMP